MFSSWDMVVGTKAYEENLERLKNIADSKGYRLNPDGERVKKVVGLMTRNYDETKQNFCPCKQSHPLDIKNDTTCPCPDLDAEVAKEGNCFCRLFFK